MERPAEPAFLRIREEAGLQVTEDLLHSAPAQPGHDLERFSSSILVQPGQEVVEVPLTILGDRKPEMNETFHLRYWYGRDTQHFSRVIITIIDDDEAGRRRSVARP